MAIREGWKRVLYWANWTIQEHGFEHRANVSPNHFWPISRSFKSALPTLEDYPKPTCQGVNPFWHDVLVESLLKCNLNWFGTIMVAYLKYCIDSVVSCRQPKSKEVWGYKAGTYAIVLGLAQIPIERIWAYFANVEEKIPHSNGICPRKNVPNGNLLHLSDFRNQFFC